jgi:hypothetical protein
LFASGDVDVIALRAQRDGAFDDAKVEAIGVRDELEASSMTRASPTRV